MSTSESSFRLEESLRPPSPASRRIGPVDPHEILPITVTVRRRRGSSPLPDQEHWASTPPGERQFLSTEDFEERYGADTHEIESVANFLREHGLIVVEKNLSQRAVIASGTAANVQKAFAVELSHYETEAIKERPHRQSSVQLPAAKGQKSETRAKAEDKPEESSAKSVYVGYEGYVHIPPSLANIVEAVFGLDRRRLARRAITPFPTITPLTPPQVATLYDFPDPSPHIKKETIGLLEFSDPIAGLCGYYPSDVTDYFTTSLGIGPGYTAPTLTDIGVNGSSNSPGGFADIEVALDIQVAGAAAQGAHINVYFTTWDENGWILAIERAVHPKPGERRPSVISISWGCPEFDSLAGVSWTAAAIHALSTTFQEAAMFGTTVLVASGDQGSSAQLFDGNAHVDYPESDPWVTSVGGTTIGNVSGSSFTEITWVADGSGGAEFGTSGGGISDVFPLPFWQHHHNVPLSVNAGHRKGRGVPDVAGYARGYSIVYAGTTQPDVQGTSEAAPLYAGLVVVFNSHLGERVGYCNPTLYDGRSNSYFGAPGYTSTAGWDACTGLGSLRGRALLKALQRHHATTHEVGPEQGFTGKVAGLVFDRFGEFDGFLMVDLAGGERKFDSRDGEVEQVVSRAWSEHVTTTVLVRDKEPRIPVSIILRGRP